MSHVIMLEALDTACKHLLLESLTPVMQGSLTIDHFCTAGNSRQSPHQCTSAWTPPPELSWVQ